MAQRINGSEECFFLIFETEKIWVREMCFPKNINAHYNLSDISENFISGAIS
jgi:hypothetical protein